MKKHSWKERLQYRFDNIMSKGTVALIGLLFGITMIVVGIIGILATLTGAEGGAGSLIWVSLMHALDAGTLAGDTLENIPYVILMSLVTLCGLFVTSILIGIISNGFEEKLNQLRKGTSTVVEEGHTLVIGFNENIYTILSELIIANSNHQNGCIVVVGEEDKEEMEEAIASRIPDKMTTRIICRSGSLNEPYIWERCATENCKNIIVNLYDDAQLIKVVLSVTSYLKDRELLYPDLFLTVSVNEEQNADAVKIAGGDRVEAIYAKDAISRIIAHTSRHPGLSVVMTELFSFDGDELYFEEVQEVVGKSFGEILNAFSNAIVFGISNEQGTFLNPPMDTIIQEGDKLILFEEDDGSFVLRQEEVPVNKEAIATGAEYLPQEEKANLLVLGYNAKLPAILSEYDCYVAQGTKVSIFSESADALNEETFQNVELRYIGENNISRKRLQEVLSEGYSNVLVLSNTELDAEEADAHTLLLLIYLWDIAQKENIRFTITSEMCKSANQKLAMKSHADDFVIGSNIVNHLMTQVAENRQLIHLFDEILCEEGSEMYMKPIGRYVRTGQPVNFWTLTESARQKGEIAVGYKRSEGENAYIVTNPVKDECVTFDSTDMLIVVAQD